ncbi:MAG: 4'-phosphopantetheinyl transferase superfamily protein [Planctomycetes bacterium]|nr:4'-phosphopantetheinyl transferase superfamily protein [Planctomycetota bacterium]
MHVWWHAVGSRHEGHALVYAALRSVAAEYTGIATRDVAFAVRDGGKPDFAGAAADLRFSVAHATGIAVVAVVVGHDVGIDVEAVRTDLDVLSVAAAHFAPSDTAGLRALTGADRTRAFFRSWVRKEALLKCVGTGLGRGLASARWTDDAAGPAAIGWPAPSSAPLPDGRVVHDLRVRDIACPVGYSAAVAVRGADARWTVVVHRTV